jgi:hypothetical protein
VAVGFGLPRAPGFGFASSTPAPAPHGAPYGQNPPALPELLVRGDGRCLVRCIVRDTTTDPERKLDRDELGEPVDKRERKAEKKAADDLRNKYCDLVLNDRDFRDHMSYLLAAETDEGKPKPSVETYVEGVR